MPLRRPRPRALVPGLSLAAILVPTLAHAHVKWFCAFDVAGQPRGLERVLCQDFEALVVVALACLLCGAFVEGSPLGVAILRAMDATTGWARRNTEVIIRAVCGFFFVSLWNVGGILLTPELKTESTLVPWFQLFLAACLVWRQTLPIVGLGIAILFVSAVTSYGPFHLADYPIFLGMAAYLSLVGVGRTYFGIKPLDLLRYTTAVTLMWASVEKWAFPQWSFPLFERQPDVALGFDPEFFMRAAGVVEFALAFALVCPPLVRRVASVLLLATFVSAIFEFGKVDAIGHSPIIAALLGFIADDAKQAVRRRDYALIPVGFATSVAGFLGLYYVLHEYAYGTFLLTTGLPVV